jgi:hypothetical protein
MRRRHIHRRLPFRMPVLLVPSPPLPVELLPVLIPRTVALLEFMDVLIRRRASWSVRW